MQFATIASGSSGNCIYAGNHETEILIDVGISKKRIEEGLQNIGKSCMNIKGILITHEHTDHIQGLGVLTRKYHIPVYATKGTICEIFKHSSLGKLDESLFHVIRADEPFKIESLTIHPFTIFHDARDPVSYQINDDCHSIGMVTDIGYYDHYIIQSLLHSDLLYIEANHDIRMLETGPYPYQLKQRILGNYGHLCNEAAGQLIGHLLHDKLQHIILGHLSKDNNFPDLALQAVKNELIDHFSFMEDKIPVQVAPRDNAMNIITL